MSGSKRPETETAIDGWIFVLAGAPCFESRRPCSIAVSSRPRAWGRLPGRGLRARERARMQKKNALLN